MTHNRAYFDIHAAQFTHKRRNEDDIEFIRKDSLLAWAKDPLEDEDVKKRAANGNRFVEGYLAAMEDLIQDIEAKFI